MVHSQSRHRSSNETSTIPGDDTTPFVEPKRYRSLVEESSDGFYCFDAASGLFLFLNSRAQGLLGVSMTEAADMRIWELLDSQELPVFKERLKTLLAGQPLVPDRFTFTVLRDDTHRLRLEIGMGLIAYEDRTVVQGILRDVTDHEALQFKLEKAQRLNTIAIMADGIADRLLNATEVIRQNIEQIEQSPTASVELLKHLAQIKGAGRLIDRLTGKLLSFSRGGIYHPERLDLNEFVAGLLPLFRQNVKPSIRLTFTADPYLPPVPADPVSLQTLLLAVISNADEAIADKGRMGISTLVKTTDHYWALHNPDLSPGRYAGIEIKDSGCGMDAAILRRVCEPYFSTKFHGRGLGMAAVYGIVRRHRGWLTIDSTPKRGTRVTIYLPSWDLASGDGQRPDQVPLEESRESVD